MKCMAHAMQVDTSNKILHTSLFKYDDVIRPFTTRPYFPYFCYKYLEGGDQKVYFTRVLALSPIYKNKYMVSNGCDKPPRRSHLFEFTYVAGTGLLGEATLTMFI